MSIRERPTARVLSTVPMPAREGLSLTVSRGGDLVAVVETQKGAVFLVNRTQTDSILTDLIWQDGQTLQIEKA